LFIGVDWIRKGGDIAFKVAKKLNQSGLRSELIVVGCQPIINEPIPDFVKPLGFISKQTDRGKQQIANLFVESHFLILPSRAECYGIVFCEANAFGIPCLASSVGGIPTIIKDNLNGRTFDKDASIDEYCQYILNLFKNYTEYKKLAISTFHEYQSRLNWSVAGQAVKRLLNNIISTQ
jgi:glycosyltransferase involved in cell wall biosynthesis